MSSAGAQAGALAIAVRCHWPCRPSACANKLSSCLSLSSSCALRRSSNGYHAVLSIIWFSLVHGPQRRPPARGQRGPGACIVVHLPNDPTITLTPFTVKNIVHHPLRRPLLVDIPSSTHAPRQQGKW